MPKLNTKYKNTKNINAPPFYHISHVIWESDEDDNDDDKDDDEEGKEDA